MTDGEWQAAAKGEAAKKCQVGRGKGGWGVGVKAAYSCDHVLLWERVVERDAAIVQGRPQRPGQTA